MKKLMVSFMIGIACLAAIPNTVKAQGIADDLQQLALDVQKLAGLKSVLKQMYTGYELLDKGYNAVKDVSKGNYTLQEAFLDGLMIVSPTVRKYPRVQDIINDQLELVSEYKSACNTFKQDPHITPDEIAYMMDVYNNLVTQSLDNLSELTMVMSDNQTRMSDAQRIASIDRLYAAGSEELTFLRQFNNNTRTVAIARAQDANDKRTIQKLYGVQ